MNISIGSVQNLGAEEQIKLNNLIDVYNYHWNKNQLKQKYYEGAVTLNDVNLGLALPDGMGKLSVGCEWGSKAVDVLAARSMFDGYVSADGSDYEELSQIMNDNNMISQYIKACKDELKFGCTFATLSADEKIGCKIRFHSPQTAAALWNGEKAGLIVEWQLLIQFQMRKMKMYGHHHILIYIQMMQYGN